jgi:hypothetical protein
VYLALVTHSAIFVVTRYILVFYLRLKGAIVKLLYRKGGKTSAANYRAISLLTDRYQNSTVLGEEYLRIMLPSILKIHN